jgi:hypothetical protein
MGNIENLIIAVHKSQIEVYVTSLFVIFTDNCSIGPDPIPVHKQI